MVEPIDNTRPVYNAVKINIKKPEVNAGVNKEESPNSVVTDNGIYNAVSIDIDSPKVNTEPQKIYEYPVATNPITYDMLNVAPMNLPKMPTGIYAAYQTTNLIIPKMSNSENIETIEAEEIPIEDTSEEEIDEENNSVKIPTFNYTTLELGRTKSNEPEAESTQEAEEADMDTVNLKKPEIVEGEEIMPEVDIPLVLLNLENSDFDTQARQMEEIARISLDNSENAIPYIVRDIFSELINISQKDTTALAAPTDDQIEARKKVMANTEALEAVNSNDMLDSEKTIYSLSPKEIALAAELSPMEQAERNKEYALYTLAILSKVYTDEVEKQTGNIVPMTDIPGSAAMVDALRFNPNAGVKSAAIDALSYIQRPEYNEELSTLFALAQADTNSDVVKSANKALEKINKTTNK